jgi:hypothetical protein
VNLLEKANASQSEKTDAADLYAIACLKAAVNRSYCCKTISYTKPTVNNFSSLYLGRPQQKNTLWGLHDSIAGFTETPALPAAAEPQIQVLPPIARKGENRNKQHNERQPLRKIAAEVIDDDDDFYDELDEEEFDEEIDE